MKRRLPILQTFLRRLHCRLLGHKLWKIRNRNFLNHYFCTRCQRHYCGVDGNAKDLTPMDNYLDALFNYEEEAGADPLIFEMRRLTRERLLSKLNSDHTIR